MCVYYESRKNSPSLTLGSSVGARLGGALLGVMLVPLRAASSNHLHWTIGPFHHQPMGIIIIITITITIRSAESTERIVM